MRFLPYKDLKHTLKVGDGLFVRPYPSCPSAILLRIIYETPDGIPYRFLTVVEDIPNGYEWGWRVETKIRALVNRLDVTPYKGRNCWWLETHYEYAREYDSRTTVECLTDLITCKDKTAIERLTQLAS